MEVASMRALQAPPRPPYLSSKSVRKYQNTIQIPYLVASAASASGFLETALSKPDIEMNDHSGT